MLIAAAMFIYANKLCLYFYSVVLSVLDQSLFLKQPATFYEANIQEAFFLLRKRNHSPRKDL